MARITHEGVAESVARNIRDRIDAGELRHGQALPSTRKLAAEYEVSVKSVNTAMASLVSEGLVVAHDRAGRTVNAPDQQIAKSAKPSQPQVVIVGGYAGSGKTELGRVIARETQWAILDKDTTTRPVVETALELLGQPPSDRIGDVYLNSIRPAEYDALVNTMVENVECGVSVILTAPFLQEITNRAWLDRMRSRCESLSAQMRVVWVTCDEESMRFYIKHRGAARDSWKLENWGAYMDSINIEFRPEVEHFIVDNSRGSRPLREQALELLRNISKGS
jgi:DNA-binding transcriptional regulator YhcF (GntR family)